MLQVLAYVRRHEGQRVLCAFNFSERAASLALPADLGTPRPLADSGASNATVRDAAIDFPPWGVLFARLA